ncbi:hypothetical protein [Vagococcus fluvialis]|uniref:hypothetical protein n=1 Tax=Vagococcus fluvialis TaxID=2738 RepID=UPI003B2145ED
MDPELVDLGVRLAEVGARNTASAIGSKLRAMKQGRDDKKTIAEMNDLIYELLEEKQEIEIIAKTYQEEIISQKLSEEDLSFVSNTVLPVLKEFMENVAETQDEQEQASTLKTIETVEALEPLLSINTLNVLQMIGFNFKKGIGEPLTELLKTSISGENKINQLKLNELVTERDVEYFKIIQDEHAFERYMSLR